jgi:hypothetical protein
MSSPCAFSFHGELRRRPSSPMAKVISLVPLVS